MFNVKEPLEAAVNNFSLQLSREHDQDEMSYYVKCDTALHQHCIIQENRHPSR